MLNALKKISERTCGFSVPTPQVNSGATPARFSAALARVLQEAGPVEDPPAVETTVVGEQPWIQAPQPTPFGQY